MTDREKQELEIKQRVFEAVLDGVRTGRMTLCPDVLLSDLSSTAIHLLLGHEEAQ